MEYYVGLDVSLKSTHICIMDQDRRMRRLHPIDSACF